MTLRNYLPLLRALVSVLTLAFLAVLYDFRQTFHLVAIMPRADIAAAVALFVLTTVLSIYRWSLTLPRSVRLLAVARSFVASRFYSLLPAGQIGSELSKVMLLANRADLSVLTGSVLFDKLVGLLALGLLGSVAWFFASGASVWMIVLVLVVVACCVLTLACAPFAAVLLSVASAKVPKPMPRLCAKLSSLAAPISHWATDPWLLGKVLILGLVGQGCMVAIYLSIARGLTIELSVAELTLFVVVANLATLVPISLGGIGVREASLVGLLAADGVRGESALALSLTVFGVFLLGAAAGAAVEFQELTHACRRFISRHQRRARTAKARRNQE